MSDFVPHHVLVPDAAPAGGVTAFVLHGILGSGRNWRSLATRLAADVPGLRLVLVDLRNHGDSSGAPPPHTLAACAADLRALATRLGTWPDAVIGHSFGGKVALQYAQDGAPGLRQVWVLDATPEASPADVREPLGVDRVVAALHDIPLPLATRQTVADELLRRGFSQDLAGWMTTNLRPVPGGYAWKFDLPGVEAMLDSYFATDFWPLLEAPPPGLRIDVVRAGREPRWTPELLARFDDVPADRVALHTLPDAGHWLHVDDPEGLLGLLTPSLRGLLGET